jgi:hypothetical protein
MELDKIPLWRGEHVPVKQLIDDFARYLYLPRLSDSQVLLEGIGDGLSLLTWESDTFAYADSYDEALGRYRGLRTGANVNLSGASGLLVKPDAARRQRAAEQPAAPSGVGVPSAQSSVPSGTNGPLADAAVPTGASPTAALPKRFHGSVCLDATRVGRDAGRIADEVISHLTGLVGSRVSVTLEVQAEVQQGVPEKVVRTVTENCRTLKFQDHGFEES